MISLYYQIKIKIIITSFNILKSTKISSRQLLVSNCINVKLLSLISVIFNNMKF